MFGRPNLLLVDSQCAKLKSKGNISILVDIKTFDKCLDVLGIVLWKMWVFATVVNGFLLKNHDFQPLHTLGGR